MSTACLRTEAARHLFFFLRAQLHHVKRRQHFDQPRRRRQKKKRSHPSTTPHTNNNEQKRSHCPQHQTAVSGNLLTSSPEKMQALKSATEHTPASRPPFSSYPKSDAAN